MRFKLRIFRVAKILDKIIDEEIVWTALWKVEIKDKKPLW